MPWRRFVRGGVQKLTSSKIIGKQLRCYRFRQDERALIWKVDVRQSNENQFLKVKIMSMASVGEKIIGTPRLSVASGYYNSFAKFWVTLAHIESERIS